MSKLSKPIEVAALTGLRGFAAFWVLLYHAWVEAGPRIMAIGSGDFALDLTPAFSGGWTGVDIFFTLSAFLLSLPFVSWQLGLAERPSLGTFWLRRVLRIFPAYYAQIAVLLVLAGVFGMGEWPELKQILGNLVLWFNFGNSGVAPLNAVAYTLSIEFCFYILLPLLAYLLRPRWWVFLLLLAIVETQIYRHLMFDPAAAIPHNVVVLEQLPGRLDQFVFGMLAAYAYGRVAATGRLFGVRANDGLFLLGCLGVTLMLVLGHLGSATYWQGSWLLFAWHSVVGASVAAILFACASGSRIGTALFANRPLRYLGIISFSIYLWHYPILQWLHPFFDRIPGYRLIWTLPLLLLLSCLVASMSYYLIERPFLRTGRRSDAHPGVTTELMPAATTDRNS